ncbi:MAG: hypothetical protein K9L66_09640 [Spirochaetaceae bacterium]|nr:hypothetical protein [Spirochaetaceae bacterium]MCF7951756.1 hypothetical protein [Spirochaetaceae bacterium]
MRRRVTTDGRGWEENYFGDFLVFTTGLAGMYAYGRRRTAAAASPKSEFICVHP